MAYTYTEFKKLGMDLSPVGIERHTEDISYFCTPVGMRIIGWAGVDGIHYGFVRGYGERVFAVNPENFGGEYVHPLAFDFEDFLRLLIACGDCNALEQAWMWNREQFEAFLEEYPPDDAQRAVMAELAETTGLEPMEDVWDYLRCVRENYDASKLRFSKEYYETVGEDDPFAGEDAWKVYYEGGYREGKRKDRPGEKVSSDACFFWGKEIWFVPAVYVCTKGLVVDYCVELESWKRAEAVEFRSYFTLNGKPLRESSAFGECWIPEHLLPPEETNSDTARWIVEYYGLDASRAWVFRRVSCPWETVRKPKEIRSLEVKLVRDMEVIPGKTFRNPSVGDGIDFRHPVSGVKHRLIVKAYERQILPEESVNDADYEMPRHLTVMRYEIEPSLSRGNFTVRDCAASDVPRRRKTEQKQGFSSVLAIIGEIAGPAAVTTAVANTEMLRGAASALRFEETFDVEWKMEFREKRMEDVEVTILG